MLRVGWAARLGLAVAALVGAACAGSTPAPNATPLPPATATRAPTATPQPPTPAPTATQPPAFLQTECPTLGADTPGAEAAAALGAHFDQQPRYFFINPSVIVTSTAVTVTVHAAVKCTGAFLPLDEPWEEEPFPLSSQALYVFGLLYDPDDGLYKLWYGLRNLWTDDTGTAQQEFLTLYADSRDGLNWRKPSLGLIEHDGSTANNIVFSLPLGNVFKDPADPDPARRFKAVGTSAAGLLPYYSPDGLTWVSGGDESIVPIRPFDNAVGFWDPVQQRYQLLLRAYATVSQLERRIVSLAQSDDFQFWSAPEQVLVPTETDDGYAQKQQFAYADIYALSLAQSGGSYFGFPLIFQQLGYPERPGANDGVLEVQFAFSTDLRHWLRPSLAPVIPRGPAGAFDSGMILPAPAPLWVGDEVWLYYVGYQQLHLGVYRDPQLALAKWRLDGFASLSNAGLGEAMVATRLVPVTGDHLRLNAQVSGVLQAELRDVAGQVIPGFEREASLPISGDQVDHALTWRDHADVSALAGQLVQLRLYFPRGSLYSFWFD